MMETIHCNGCHHIPQLPGMAQRRYFISSCGHVFCINCVQQNELQCSVCKAEKSRFLEVNQNARPDIKAYFMDPLAVLRENLKQTTQVLNFQKAQSKSYQGCVAKLYEAYKSMMQENNSLKQKIEKVNRDKDELQRKLDEMSQEHQSWMGHANGMNFVQQQGPISTPGMSRRNNMIFNDMRSSNIIATPSDTGTPFNITTNVPQTPLFSPSPTPSGSGGRAATPGSAGRVGNQGSGGRNSAFLVNGRLTLPRTPQDTNSNIRRVGESQSQSFTPAGRGVSQMRSSTMTSDTNASQDIVSRLRQLQRLNERFK